MKTDILALIVFFMMGFNLCIPVIQKQFTEEINATTVKADPLGDDTPSISEIIVLPGNQTVSAGDNLTIDIYCIPNQPVKAFEFMLSFDPFILQANSVVEGNFFSGYETFFSNGIINNVAGTIANVYGLVVGQGNVSEPGMLVSISFSAVSGGTSSIDFISADICNETMYLPVNLFGGNVTVESVAYHYWYAPENSFGIQEMKTVNWSYFKSLFLAHTDWMLEYKRYEYSDWTDGSDYLTIERTWNESGFWKFNLIFDVPVDIYSARFTFGVDLPVLQYVERSGYEVWINYTANATETYSVMFNWSDIASIPNLVITKGTQDGMFWFRFRRDNIPAGHYEFDPIFGEKKEKQVKYDFYSPSMNETLEIFYNEPKLSLHRWDKECYLNVSAIPTKDTVVFADSSDYKLKWKENEKEYHFYPLINNSFEFDVILNEKPDTNIVSLDIDSTNLNFYYQPPLNESLNLSNYDFVNETHAIKNGSVVIYRPENVVGSYAVYHSSKTGHVIGQTNYKTGKAFHIYRPKVFDADGSWTWGILNIDEDTGILSVEISQDFFDEAVYPVTIDPDFGYTSEGSTNLGGPGDMLFGYLFASPATAGMTGVSMNMYGYYQGSSANVKMLIYPYTDGLTYITNGITGAVALTDISSLKTATFGTAPSIAASTNYLLTVIADLDFYIKGDNAGGTEKQDWSNSYATPTNFNWDGGSSTKGSIYCTYEVAEENNAPTQSGESPTNSSTDISVTPSLHVICTDADSDTMTATWRSNSSGAWVDFATNTSISTGTNITQDNSNFSAYSTTYYWSVNLTDDTDWCNETYHFTTIVKEWVTLDTWNITLGNMSISPYTLDTWNITLSNLTIAPFTIDTWNITLSNTPQPYILDTWNLTLSNLTISPYVLDTWNITLSNTPQPHILDTWNLTLSNLTISPFTIDTWNVTLGNLTISAFTIDTWNITLSNTPQPYILDTWNVTLRNLTISSYVLDTWNITLSNTPQPYILDTWNLTFSNLTISPFTIDTWNLTLGNLTISPYVLDTWNITLGNLTISPFTIDTWNLTLSNLTISPYTLDTWNITLSNTPQPYILDTWNLTFSNLTISPFTIDTWNITLSNTPQPYILDTWNLTLSNTSVGEILDRWNITLSNSSFFFITDVKATPSEAVIDDVTINITCNVTSLYAIVNVTVNMTEGHYDMANIGDLYHYIAINSTIGIHYYHIYANDTSGDQIESSTYSFKIIGLSCSFTYTVNGGLMTLTPTITGATHYKWTFVNEMGVKGQTSWIPIEDMGSYIQGYVYPTTIRAYLSAKNIHFNQYANYSDVIRIYKSSFEKPTPTEEEPEPEPTNIFKEIADAVGKWIGERNSGELLFMAVMAVIAALFVVRKKYPQKKFIYQILKKKKKKEKERTPHEILIERIDRLEENVFPKNK